MKMSEQLTPTAELAETAEYAGQSPVGAIVLEETIRAGLDGEITESGRTWCSSDAVGEYRDPIDRHRAAIDLANCPPDDAVVTWHTHTTEDQLFNPDHSLPDIANVAFGKVDISIIPGIETDHILVGAADREAMADELRSAVGLDVDDPGEITAAIADGRIPDPPRLRDRLFETYDALEKRPRSNRDHFADHARAIYDGDAAPPDHDLCDGVHTIDCDPDIAGGDHVVDETTAAAPPVQSLRASATLRREARVTQHALSGTLDQFDVLDTMVGTTVGMLTSRAIERVVFGD